MSTGDDFAVSSSVCFNIWYRVLLKYVYTSSFCFVRTDNQTNVTMNTLNSKHN